MKRLTYEEICDLEGRNQICGYFRNIFLAKNGKYRGTCALDDERCSSRLPMNPECPMKLVLFKESQEYTLETYIFPETDKNVEVMTEKRLTTIEILVK